MLMYADDNEVTSSWPVAKCNFSSLSGLLSIVTEPWPVGAHPPTVQDSVHSLLLIFLHFQYRKPLMRERAE